MEEFSAELCGLAAPWAQEAPANATELYDLRLVPVSEHHIDAIFQAFQNDPKMREGLGLRSEYTRMNAEEFACRISPSMWAEDSPSWAIETRPHLAASGTNDGSEATDPVTADPAGTTADPVTTDPTATIPATSNQDDGAGEAASAWTFAGTLGLHKRSKNYMEVGFWVTASARGKGVATWATRLALQVAFETLGAVRVTHLARVGNWSSLRVARACGFVYEGIERELDPAPGTVAAASQDSEPVEPTVIHLWQSAILLTDYQEMGGKWPVGEARDMAAIDGSRPQSLVAEFHNTYEMPDRVRDAQPTSLDYSRLQMRMSLIAEEVGELFQAVYGGDALASIQKLLAEIPDQGSRDVVEAADALGDLVYVVYGMALESGIDLDAVLAEIHRSNLSKLMPDGTVRRREDGKVLKGPNFSPPDIARVLQSRLNEDI